MYRFLKRFFDISFSIILLLLTLPVLIVLVIILSLHFKSTPFFKQKRLGYKNKEFWIYKLKTMRDLFDDSGQQLPDKQRITYIGRIIRKSSLDELAQIINILKGNMSFIGPRPLSIKNLPFYTERELKRHNVRPGITGLAQINGRNNLPWNERLDLDVFYVEKLSFKLDLKIFLKTFKKVIFSKDISSDTPPIPSLIKTRGNINTVNDR